MNPHSPKPDAAGDGFREIETVASATECTGLMPALPLEEPEGDENLAQLYDIHAPEEKREEQWHPRNPWRTKEKTAR